MGCRIAFDLAISGLIRICLSAVQYAALSHLGLRG